MMNKDNKFNKAVSFLKAGNYDQALAIFTELIQSDPANADYWSERGVTYFHLKNKKLSLADMDKAVELQPGKSYRYSSRAYIRGHYKMTEAAIEDYRKAVELDPEDAVAYNNLGLIEEQLGYQDQAIQNFNIADELMKDSEETLTTSSSEIPSPAHARNIQKELEEEAKNKSIWTELKSLASKEGRASFGRFIRSGMKKT